MSLIATVFTKSSVIGACAARAVEFKRKGADSPKATAIRSRLMWVLPVLSPKRLEKNSVPSQRDSSVEVPKSSGGSTDASCRSRPSRRASLCFDAGISESLVKSRAQADLKRIERGDAGALAELRPILRLIIGVWP